MIAIFTMYIYEITTYAMNIVSVVNLVNRRYFDPCSFINWESSWESVV